MLGHALLLRRRRLVAPVSRAAAAARLFLCRCRRRCRLAQALPSRARRRSRVHELAKRGLLLRSVVSSVILIPAVRRTWVHQMNIGDMETLVRRDRNHASVVIWSACNEVECFVTVCAGLAL